MGHMKLLVKFAFIVIDTYTALTFRFSAMLKYGGVRICTPACPNAMLIIMDKMTNIELFPNAGIVRWETWSAPMMGGVKTR